MNAIAKTVIIGLTIATGQVSADLQPTSSRSGMETTPSSVPFEPCDDNSVPKCPNGAALKEDSFPPCDDGKPVCADGKEAKPPPHEHKRGHGDWSGSESGFHSAHKDNRGGEHSGHKGADRGGFGVMVAVSGVSFLAGAFVSCLAARCKRGHTCCHRSGNLASGERIIIQDGAPVTMPSVTSSKFAILPSGAVVVTKAVEGEDKV